MPAGATALNGAGELTGFLQIPMGSDRDADLPHVDDGRRPHLRRCSRRGVRGGFGDRTDEVVIPVVGECDDSWLNDARTVQVEADDADPP